MGGFMSNPGKAIGKVASGTFVDQPPYSYETDPRTGYQKAAEQQRMQGARDYTTQYQKSMTDPSFAIASPELQRMQEQELTDQAFNRMGYAGAGASGSARALAQKALVDYRLGLIDKQNSARENLRQSINSMLTGGTPYHVTDVSGKPSPMTQTEMTAGQMAVSAAGGAGKAGGMGV